MTPAAAALTFVSLLVIVDPVALAPVFGALTRDMDAARARRTARVAVAAGFALLAAAGLLGHRALAALGAESALVHLVVAAVLLVVGAAMLVGGGDLGRLAGRAGRDPALVPLAVPLIAGPGALGAMVMFAGRNAGQPAAIAMLYAMLAVVAAFTYGAFRAAEPITRRLGPRGVRTITRILGAVLVAAAARFLWEGLRDYGVIGGAGARGAAG